MARRLLKLALLCVLGIPGLAFSDQVAVSTFKGINTNESSVIIGPEFSQDELNVTITPGGKSLKKGDGYGLYKTIYASQLQGIHGGYHFFNSSGNDVQVWGSSTSLYGIVNDATPTQLVSSATLNSTWDCADTQGSAYCVTSNRDAYIKTSGATMTWYTSPLGTMVEATPDRIAVAGVSGSLSSIYFSASNAFTTFTTALLPTDPFVEPIAAPGSKLTHLRWGCGKLLWWKDQSFGWFAFDDQYTGQIKIVSDTIGTFDNTSAIDPGGNVWFRGQDGHIWEYDCSGLIKQSIEISPQVQASGRRTTNSWTQTTASDFGAGGSVNLDTFTVSGNIQLNSFTDAFPNLSSYTINNGHFSLGGIGVIADGSSAGASSVICNMQTVSTMPVVGITTNYILHSAFKFTPVAAGKAPGVRIGWINSSNNGYGMDIIYGSTAGSMRAGTIIGNNVSFGFTANANISDSSLHTADLFYSATGYAEGYVDGTYLGNFQDTTYSGMKYFQVTCDCGTISPPNQCTDPATGSGCQFSNISITASTGTYYSAVNNAPNITNWNTFLSNDVALGTTTINYYVRASSNPFTVLSSTPAWTLQTKNTQVNLTFPALSIATTYFQMRSDIIINKGIYQTPSVNDFTFNWYEGSAADQAYMLYFDNAIWESVSYGVGVSSNTYIFRRDLINDGWLLYNFGAGGMLVQNNHLLFGDVGSTAQIFQYGVGTSYNGTAINAYWKSKDFSGPDPFIRNAYTNIDSLFKQNTAQTVAATYDLDTSTTTTSFNIYLSSTTQSIVNHRKNLPAGKTGYLFNIKYADNTTTSAWELLGYRFTFNPQSYIPSQ